MTRLSEEMTALETVARLRDGTGHCEIRRRAHAPGDRRGHHSRHHPRRRGGPGLGTRPNSDLAREVAWNWATEDPSRWTVHSALPQRACGR